MSESALKAGDTSTNGDPMGFVDEREDGPEIEESESASQHSNESVDDHGSESGSDNGSDSDDDSNQSGSESNSSNSEDGMEEDYIIDLLGKRPSSAASSSTKRMRGSDEDEEEVHFVPDNLDDIDTSNIIPRAKRRAAMASGLTRSSGTTKTVHTTSKSNQFDSDDEEGDF